MPGYHEIMAHRRNRKIERSSMDWKNDFWDWYRQSPIVIKGRLSTPVADYEATITAFGPVAWSGRLEAITNPFIKVSGEETWSCTTSSLTAAANHLMKRAEVHTNTHLDLRRLEKERDAEINAQIDNFLMGTYKAT